jgi:hypothetical protein
LFHLKAISLPSHALNGVFPEYSIIIFKLFVVTDDIKKQGIFAILSHLLRFKASSEFSLLNLSQEVVPQQLSFSPSS